MIRPVHRHILPAAFLATSLAMTLAACGPSDPGDGADGQARQATQAQQAAPETSAAAYRGRAIAEHVCTQCHDIGGAGPEQAIGARTFRAVAADPATSAESLATRLRTSHPQMPHYLFPANEVEDLVAYILSLRQPTP